MNEYRDSRASLIRFCKDLTGLAAQFGEPLTVKNLDAFAEPEQWDSAMGDLIGPKEFQFTWDDKICHIESLLVISTVNDPEGFRLSDLINFFLGYLSPGKAIPVFDANTGASRGCMTVANGTQVAPPLSSKSREMQPIMIHLVWNQMP